MNSEAMNKAAPLLEVESQRSTSTKVLKVGIALWVGSLVGVMALSANSAKLYSTDAAESTNLLGQLAGSLRSARPSPVLPRTISQIPGPSPWKELTIAALEANQGCSVPGRDVSMNANLKQMVASLSPKDKAVVAAVMTPTVG